MNAEYTNAKRALTIGEVIDALNSTEPKKDARVYFAFANLIPTHIASYRGSYAMPALGWGTEKYWSGQNATNAENVSPHALAKRLQDALAENQFFTGWKGGEYQYTRNHILYVDNPGQSNGVVIERVELIYDRTYAVLHTRQLSDQERYSDEFLG